MQHFGPMLQKYRRKLPVGAVDLAAQRNSARNVRNLKKKKQEFNFGTIRIVSLDGFMAARTGTTSKFTMDYLQFDFGQRSGHFGQVFGQIERSHILEKDLQLCSCECAKSFDEAGILLQARVQFGQRAGVRPPFAGCLVLRQHFPFFSHSEKCIFQIARKEIAVERRTSSAFGCLVLFESGAELWMAFNSR